MVTKSVKSRAYFINRQLEGLAYIWEHLPSPLEFAARDDDDRIDYIVEFRADMATYQRVLREAGEGLLTDAQLERPAYISRLVAEKQDQFNRLANPPDDDDD